ncbi:ATP-binding protein [Mesorhizobium shangrilense]|uniref:ATP-binding protein n=1 Tax=Mesorhizobium shangrilense TaxID=460060 RepID=A0ABV2D707_9HYPH
MAELTLKAKHDHLAKVASTRDYVKALAEFVWNALDADADAVSVEFSRNSLGGLHSILIRDNGTGISKSRAEHDFESLGDSWKLQKSRTALNSRVVHGKEGQGRLKFYSLARKANWTSVYEEEGGLLSLSIAIDADNLHKSSVSESTKPKNGAARGTVLELAPLKDTFDWLTSEEARSEFGAIFAPYILQYPSVSIVYDRHLVDPNATIERAHEFERTTIVCPGRSVKDLALRVIEWKSRAGSRKIYFGSETGVVLGSQAANVTAPGFDFSVYAYSPFFQGIADANLLEVDGLTDPDFARVLEYIRDTVGDYFRTRQAEKSGELIQELIDAGVYPYEGDPRDEVERRERQVFDIATHAVSSYSRDFKKADNSLKKITLGLLREAISHNPESVSRILRAVFNLPKVRQDEFSSLLQKTELGHIISASSLIADRVVALKVLSEMVFEPKHRHTIKERGELDVLIRDNTWIFGESFHFTMAEVGLTKIMHRVSQELSLLRAKSAKARKPDGKVGRIDSFMGRVVPHPDRQHREFMLVELKRPLLVVGRKELDQLEDYVNAILAQPDFIGTSTFWNFYLVSGEYDPVVKERITQKDRPVGLYLDKPNHKVWVKSWAELIRDAESRLQFVQEKLQIEVTAEEIGERIAQLKSSILRAGSEPSFGSVDSINEQGE